MSGKVRELNRENFAVRQHLKYVDLYANKDNYQALTYEDTLMVREELAPLIEPEDDDAKALRFDALMYGIELAYLVGKKHTRARHDLLKKVSAVSNVAKNNGGKFMHYGRLKNGSLRIGDTVVSEADHKRRQAIRRAHSATHMLQSALRSVLGEHVHQAGKLIHLTG